MPDADQVASGAGPRRRLGRLAAVALGRPDAGGFELCLAALLFVAVAGYLSLRGATNACLMLLALLSLAGLRGAWRDAGRRGTRRALLLAAAALAAPIVSVAIGQALRGEWLAKAFDAPSRLLLAIPVMLAFHHRRIDAVRILGFAAPLALIELVVQVRLDPRALVAWQGRYATYFVDTDMFGVYTLLLALFALFALKRGSSAGSAGAGAARPGWMLPPTVSRVLVVSGVCAGAYLVVASQTRTAYLLVPVAALLWLWLRRPALDARTAVCVLLALVAGVAAFSGATDRLVSIYADVSTWADASNPDTSGGFRLTMWRIAWTLFLHRPWQGYGDTGFRALLDAPWITSFASERARQMIHAGPHNELLANLLRSGVAGGLAVAMLFAVPLGLFWRARRLDADAAARRAADTGIAFMICLMLACVTFEMFTLKYTASFNALVIATLVAQALGVGGGSRERGAGESGGA
ncbi:O-antigen ligase family protein [Burkholderia plantarii]|uniref:Putative O-antigen polymerase n=1 Tax=Burkholderia plantarii TaxID=41899 RepID=A0A0B6RS03_BURPL|nr:O-antigen ligase family protein [Burkholderia plantarii]AJK44939.1 putative O-antigen polymerase [Burkholderia plantarii]